MKFTQLVVATLCVGALLGGCKGKDGDPGPAGANGTNGTNGTPGQPGPPGPSLTGSIVGFVNPIDEQGTALLPKSGVVVSVDGANPAITATTNADGRFELPSVRTGTYNLTYSRAGLATFRRIGVGHVGGDQPTYLGPITISQTSTITVPAFAAFNSFGNVAFNLTLVSPTPTTTFRYALLASATPMLTSSTAVVLTTSTAVANTNNTVHQTSISYSRTLLTNAGFASGTTVYLAATGSTSFSSTYSDPATGRLVYPALNQTISPVMSIVVP